MPDWHNDVIDYINSKPELLGISNKKFKTLSTRITNYFNKLKLTSPKVQ